MQLLVRELRERKGWNQTVLGYHAGLSPSQISLIENGKRNPSAETLQAIATALDVEVGDLFPKAGAPTSSIAVKDEEERRELRYRFKRRLNKLTTDGERLEEKLKGQNPDEEWPIGDVMDEFVDEWLDLGYFYDYFYEELVGAGQDTDEDLRKAKARLDGVKSRISQLLSHHPGDLYASQQKSRARFISRRTEQDWQQDSDKTAAEDAG